MPVNAAATPGLLQAAANVCIWFNRFIYCISHCNKAGGKMVCVFFLLRENEKVHLDVSDNMTRLFAIPFYVGISFLILQGIKKTHCNDMC